jgi:fibro-slime domain-containing protein
VSPRRLAGFVSLALCAGCGSRSGLPVDEPEPCSDAAATRGCEDECGVGTQACVAGFWASCVVPDMKRACSNDCGKGLEICTSGQWGNCQVPENHRACSTICGKGMEACTDGVWQNCDAPQPKSPWLKAVVRDFNDTHPDFEHDEGEDPGVVQSDLGSDDKPVYAGNPVTRTTHGRELFDQWYREVPGVNLSETIMIPLTPSASEPGVLGYDDDEFFPIDGQLFGNQGRIHNYHFTVELATSFLYAGGETFQFTGDDDMWVFINRKLAMDLGGVHESETARVDLDRDRGKLGIEPGNTYSLNIFFAERHTVQSNFHITTTISQFDACR